MLTFLAKAFVYEKSAKDRLERAARRIQAELARRKLRNKKAMPLDSAHLEQAMEHHLGLFPHNKGEALLKMGMMLRGSHSGQVQQSDIDLINMLPFTIFRSTVEALDRFPFQSKPYQKELAHFDKKIEEQYQRLITRPLILKEDVVAKKLEEIKELLKEHEQLSAKMNTFPSADNTNQEFIDLGKQRDLVENQLRNIRHEFSLHNINIQNEYRELIKRIQEKSLFVKSVPKNIRAKIPINFVTKSLRGLIEYKDAKLKVEMLQEKLDKFPKGEPFEGDRYIAEQQLEKAKKDVDSIYRRRIKDLEEIYPQYVRHFDDLGLMSKHLLDAFKSNPLIIDSSHPMASHYYEVFPLSDRWGRLLPNISHYPQVYTGAYQQTGLQHYGNTNILHWIRRYITPQTSYRKKWRQYLLHGSSSLFHVMDPALIAKGSHNYGWGLYTNPIAYTPDAFSRSKYRDFMRPWFRPARREDTGLEAAKIIHKFFIPHHLRFFSHDTDYTNSPIIPKIEKYFDDLARKTGQPHLIGEFGHILSTLGRIPYGSRWNHLSQDYEVSRRPGDMRQEDEMSDAGVARTKQELLDESGLQNNNPNAKLGHKVWRAIKLTFEKLGAPPNDDKKEHLDDAFGGRRHTDYKSPYRNSTYHAGLLLSSLGFAGYRHLDPESTTTSTNTNFEDFLKRKKAPWSKLRSFVILPSAFTEIPLPEHQLVDIRTGGERFGITKPPVFRGRRGRYEQPEIDWHIPATTEPENPSFRGYPQPKEEPKLPTSEQMPLIDAKDESVKKLSTFDAGRQP
jgi:hypothetical protein